jgi:predicted nucleic acid-binding protein
MNLVDSSGWLEYLADGPNAAFFEPALIGPDLVVSAINVYEVFRKVLRERGEAVALRVAAQMQRAEILPVDGTVAMRAAGIASEHGLPMADAIILATARSVGATLWTQDADFRGLDGVRFVEAAG